MELFDQSLMPHRLYVPHVEALNANQRAFLVGRVEDHVQATSSFAHIIQDNRGGECLVARCETEQDAYNAAIEVSSWYTFVPEVYTEQQGES